MNATITGLSVQNYKGIEHVELHPSGSVIVLAGKNGAGKSSFADAIAEIIDPKGVKFTPKPVRQGEDFAEATITTDKFTATRRWNAEGKATTTVKTADGAKYPSPSAFLRDVVGAVPFDPLDFARLDEKKQRDMLLSRVELEIDLDAVAAERQRLFDERTEVGRAGKALGEPDALVEGVPGEEQSALQLLALIQDARDAANSREREEEKLRRVRQDAESLKGQIERLQGQLQEQLGEASALEGVVAGLPAPVDVAPLEADLASVEETNQKVRHNATVRAHIAKRDELRGKYDELTAGLKALDDKKVAALSKAEFPVPGLSVSDDGVLLDGVPFKQANTAAQIKAAFDLVTSAQPELRIVQIRDGSLLDSDSLAHIEKVASERGFLVLVEVVDESGTVGFTFKDGKVQA
ncbi:MAG: ATP-binding protein [Mycetocola sp.]